MTSKRNRICSYTKEEQLELIKQFLDEKKDVKNLKLKVSDRTFYSYLKKNHYVYDRRDGWKLEK